MNEPRQATSKLYRLLSGIFLLLIIATTGLIFIKCSPDSAQQNSDGLLFTLLSPDETGINFQNQVDENASRGLHIYDYFYNGSGVAVGDINNDGLSDVFFAGNDVSNRLYLNKGDLEFEDISESAGIKSNKWATGVTMVDINEDGWLDIYVCSSGPYFRGKPLENELYVNNGDNTFTELAHQYGIAGEHRTTQASFFDMDNDGDLDLWMMNHALRNRGGSATEWFKRLEGLSYEDLKKESSALYKNEGNGRFVDVTQQANIHKIGFGLGLAIRDFNEDGFLDVYVANDYFIPDFLFENNADGTFTEKLDKKFDHIPYYSMGCDAADFNNDGLTDIVTVDMTPSDHVRNKTLMASMDVKGFLYLTELKNYTPQYMFNSLFLNSSFGIMTDIGQFAGVSQTDWSWAALLVDLDNDGFKDLLVTNGYRRDTKDNDWKNELAKIRNEKGEEYSPQDYIDHLQKAAVNPVPNYVYKNQDGLNFKNVLTEWGFEKPSFSNGAAYADLDNDGDLDLVINNFDEAAFVYQNNSSEKNASNFIRFRLKDGKTSNSVLHSKIEIYTGDEMQVLDYDFTRGYQSYVEPVAHFGLGSKTQVDRAIIKWNDGTESLVNSPEINKTHLIDKKHIPSREMEPTQPNSLFASIGNSYISPIYKHKEDYFDDFRKEVLLPHKQSTLGPAIAVADVNGDGLEDFYIGGAKSQAGAIYLQDETAHFRIQNSTSFAQDAGYEDIGAEFVDIDNDNDLDLYVASGGGGEFEGKEPWLQDRMYLNDGIGNFQINKNVLPNIKSSTKVVSPSDIDNDGDLDLFIGGRNTPGRYPISPKSFLLINERGTFSDQISELAPELEQLGMVTDASWLDFDKDGDDDLFVVGEWLAISVFENTGDGFKDVTNKLGLQDTYGWWNSITKIDLDNDGDQDFIVGNIGLNNKFHPSKEKPLYLYANDFDNNGSLDIVLSKIYKDHKVPVRGKECSTAQMPFISEKFPTYNEFATASLEDIYPEEELENAIQFQVYSFASVYLFNDGNGSFNIVNMPDEAQLAPINGVVINDFDKDSIKDFVIAGNRKQTEVETQPYDAGKGLLFRGRGNGEYDLDLQMKKSGLFMHKDVKDIRLIHLTRANKSAILVANNNDIIELFVSRK